jgi:H+/Cl- antiporter ClcA
MQLDRHLRRHRATWLSGRVWTGRAVFALGALAIGVAAVLFAEAADRATGLFASLRNRWLWLPLLLTTAGFALSAWLTRRWFDGA